jgi:hypothetical protein
LVDHCFESFLEGAEFDTHTLGALCLGVERDEIAFHRRLEPKVLLWVESLHSGSNIVVSRPLTVKDELLAGRHGGLDRPDHGFGNISNVDKDGVLDNNVSCAQGLQQETVNSIYFLSGLLDEAGTDDINRMEGQDREAGLVCGKPILCGFVRENLGAVVL